MGMCPATDSSPEDAAADGGRFFDLFAFLKRCATLRAQFSRRSTSVSHGRQRGMGGVLAPRRILLTVCRYSGQKYSTLSLIMQNWLFPTSLMWRASRMCVNFQEIKKVCKRKYAPKYTFLSLKSLSLCSYLCAKWHSPLEDDFTRCNTFYFFIYFALTKRVASLGSREPF